MKYREKDPKRYPDAYAFSMYPVVSRVSVNLSAILPSGASRLQFTCNGRTLIGPSQLQLLRYLWRGLHQ